MKGLAGLGAAACIAGLVALWFFVRPNAAVVVMEVKPLTSNSALPVFHQVDSELAPAPRKTK